MPTKRKTDKGAADAAPVVSRRVVRDGVIRSEEVRINLTTGDVSAEIAAFKEFFPTAEKSVKSFAAKARNVIANGATGSCLKYAEDAIFRADNCLRYLANGDAPGITPGPRGAWPPCRT